LALYCQEKFKMSDQNATRFLAGGAFFKTKTGAQYRGGLFANRLDSGFMEPQWRSVTQGLPDNVEVRAIAFHPTEKDIVFVGTQQGPYRSLDGGIHLQSLNFPEKNAVVWSFAFHPTRPKVMYVGLAPVAIYCSEDGGDHWRKLQGVFSPEYCVMRFPTRVTGLAVDPSNPDNIYASLEVSGVIGSQDGGETWSDLSKPLIKLSELPHLKSRLSSESDSSGMLDSHTIAVSAALPSQPFLALRMGIFRSPDKGQSWVDTEVGRYSALVYCRDVMVSPQDPKVMYACFSPASRSQDGSLYQSQDIGVTWSRFDHGIKADATMMKVAVHPFNPAVVSCISRCGQVFATNDSGQHWHTSRLPLDVQDVYTVGCG
jgi:hypothetical protein